MVFNKEFHKSFKKEKILLLYKLFQRIDEANKIPGSFFKCQYNLISKLDKDVTRKENYRPASQRP